MSLGSQAVSSSLAIALKVHAWAVMPALFDTKEESSEESNKKKRWTLWMIVPRMKQIEVVMTHLKTTVFTWPAHLVWHTAISQLFILIASTLHVSQTNIFSAVILLYYCFQSEMLLPIMGVFY